MPADKPTPPGTPPRLRPLPRLVFMSRWLQVPLYLGLILAQAVYVFHFWVELTHLIRAAIGSSSDVVTIICNVMPSDCTDARAALANAGPPPMLTETLIMLAVLGLIDVVMISNLLIMVIVGGYETFVSRLDLEGHPDEPEWLSHVNAGVLKVKLATAIIGISSIHLLKTFISAERAEPQAMLWQTVIHVAFLLSALAIAWTEHIVAKQKAH
ncbi:TIGR00645 family protein [soil metagenome]